LLVRLSATLACGILASQTALSQASGSCSWTGSADSDWHTAANWNCDQHDNVPGPDDAVTIAPASAVEVTFGDDAEIWSLELGIDHGDSHTEAHQIKTTADDVVLTLSGGPLVVRQTGRFNLGQSKVSGGIGARPALRATVTSSQPVLVHGRLFIGNTHIHNDVILDRPAIGGARGYVQARGWNNVHGAIHVIDGFLQPVVPGGHYGTPAPHLRIIDHDLIVEEVASVQLFADPGGFSAPAITVENGLLDQRGNVTTSAFSNASSAPFVIDAVVVNQGMIRSRLSTPPGLAFRGPTGAVHQNSGQIEIGALLGSDTEDDAVEGFGLLVEDGRSLHNTGTVKIHRLRDAEGTVANTDGGLITDATEVAGSGSHILGFAGPQAVEIEIGDAGTIERLSMAWHGEDHPDAALNPDIAGTGHWWNLASLTAGDDPASGDLSLSLPRLNAGVPRVCRYTEAPPDWDCLATQVSSGYATVAGLTELSQWAVADLADLLFGDRFEQP
jgi:hypothetical protein